MNHIRFFCLTLLRTYTQRPEVCYFCLTTEDLTIHHIIPREIGGGDVVDNLSMLCKRCHERLHSEISRRKRPHEESAFRKYFLAHLHNDIKTIILKEELQSLIF